MRNKAHDLTIYPFSSGDTLLFDANIWLYLFPAPSGFLPGFAKKYSAALKRILVAKVPLALDVLVLSEYATSYCRIEWRALYQTAYPSFKKFRQSADFASIGQAAALYANSILKLCTRKDHLFATVNIAQVLTDFEAGIADFNDGLIAEACRQHNWKLVTSDADFTEGGIELLTTNPKLLAVCK